LHLLHCSKKPEKRERDIARKERESDRKSERERETTSNKEI